VSTKRRLELLPELLPKPERSSHAASGPSTVRSRTLARLSVLAALTATASACGGKGAYGVVDPLPSPAGGTGGGSGTGGSGGAYGVVDPLPQPYMMVPKPITFPCLAGTTLTASAVYVNEPDGPLDAGSSAPDGDAGPLPDGGSTRPASRDAGPRIASSLIRVDLLTEPGVTLGDVRETTAELEVLEQTGTAGRTTLLVRVTGSNSASFVLTAACESEQKSVGVLLLLDPDGVRVSISGGG